MEAVLEKDGNIAEDIPGLPLSVMGNKWVLPKHDESLAAALMQKLGLPSVIAELMARRNIAFEEAENFLIPSIKNFLPNPSEFMDMDKAAARLTKAVINKENIVIFGDYDVDGATSSALLKRFFRTVGLEVSIYIPDRITEGYGPNINALLDLRKNGADIVVTVDCGTAAAEILEAAGRSGLDIIVIDHHIGADKNPEICALVNPNRLDEKTKIRHMAAVGMCFVLAVAINRELRKSSWFKERPEPNLLDLLDLVALGTVCDVVPLTGINRAFVAQGLKIIGQRKNPGLAALSDIAQITEKPTAYHAGFILGPRINAGGRVGKAELGAILLSSDDAEEVKKAAEELNRLNTERRALESVMLEEAIIQAESKKNQPVIILASEGWHQGVIGIICSRIKDSHKKPVAVISLENGHGKASARSIPGVDIGAAIAAAKMAGIITTGGGHAMAAGFTLEENQIPALSEFLHERLSKRIEEKLKNVEMYLDGAITISGINADFMETLSRMAPFGSSNPEPLFLLKNVQIVKSQVVGLNHLRCIITDLVPGKSWLSLKAMAFRKLETPLGQHLLQNVHKPIGLIGQIRQNEWKGNKKIEFIIEDMVA